MYPATRTDSDGQTLDGSKNNYTLTFPAGQLPPVNAFWSVTMYDGKSQFLIENPINRYLINSPMLPDMKKNADGSLTLYIQNKSPGADKEAELAACSKRHDLPGDAAVLAEDRTTFDPAAGRRHLEAARNKAGRIERPRERPPQGTNTALEKPHPQCARLKGCHVAFGSFATDSKVPSVD